SQVSGPAPATLSGAATATLTASALVAGAYSFALVVTDNRGTPSAPSTVAVTVNPATPPGTTALYRLNAGGGALATALGAFAADQGFAPSPGNTYATTAPIAGTTDDALYQTERYGTNGAMSYALAVPNGTYTVTLHFAELYWTAAGQRVFDVSLEGTPVLSRYDIFRKAGALTATTETFTVTVADGALNLALTSRNTGGVDNPKLSALEVISTSSTGSAPPVANAGPGQTLTLPTSSAVLAGAGTPAAGNTIAAYAWSQVSGPAPATLSGAATATLTASALVAG
ncbi:malectin, partial [Hymenobacter terricola]|uniref:malectin n=1 Tax=Hymenobacter terricola TaxID=2819236 RepID=UPI001CF25C18